MKVLFCVLWILVLGKGLADTAQEATRILDINVFCDGRLTLTSATPVTTTDITAASTLYFTPYKGSKVALYTGGAWQLNSFTERSLALTGLTADKNYDVFLYDNASVLTLELSAAWTNDTTRADALTTQDGIYVKSGAASRRYLGTIRATSTTTTEDSETKRFVWNYLHRARRELRKLDATVSWAYSTGSWRAANNSTANRVEVVVGQPEVAIKLVLKTRVVASATSTRYAGICYDCTDSTLADQGGAATDGGEEIIEAQIIHYPGIGYHFYQWTENGGGANTITWDGNGHFGLLGHTQA